MSQEAEFSGRYTEPAAAIGIATYRRPEMLARLLGAIEDLDYGGRTRVIVVDNDPDGSAQEVVNKAAAEARWPIQYVIEPRPGISAARNRAVDLASDVEFLAFIDDDEVPAYDWLRQLVAVQQRFDADVVGGPVLTALEKGNSWLLSQGAYERERRPTGAGPFLTGSGNLLIRLTVLRTLGELFDLRFGLTGGEDTLFLLRAQKYGLSMAWADEAIVTEFLSPDRDRLSWIIRRSFRTGTTFARAELVLGTGSLFATRASRGSKGVVHLLAGAVSGVFCITKGHRKGILRAARRASMGAGMIVGSVGFTYVEYRRNWPGNGNTPE